MKAPTSYYECHITMLGDAAKLRHEVETIHWKFSCIDGDPVLGAGQKCYATMLFNIRMDEHEVLDTLLGAAQDLAERGAEIIRRKIERVIYDDRSDKVRLCDGSECAQCQERAETNAN